MAHFAKLGAGNIVEKVEVVSNDIATTEQAGIDFLREVYKDNRDVWKQTSYNTVQNTHRLGGTPFRKNYASRGDTYNENLDAFIAPRPFPSWVLNTTTGIWEAPIAYPTITTYDDKKYVIKWHEIESTWIAKKDPITFTTYFWDFDNLTWVAR